MSDTLSKEEFPPRAGHIWVHDKDGRPEREDVWKAPPTIEETVSGVRGLCEPDPDLLPVAHACPFCGSGSLDMDIRKTGLGPIITEYRVECLLCHVRGRQAGSARSAVELWNRRKPPWPESPP